MISRESHRSMASEAPCFADSQQVFLSSVTLRHGHKPGLAEAVLPNTESHLRVRPVRCFPYSDPTHYAALVDTGDRPRTIGIIAEPSKLSADSEHVLSELLDRHYYCPEIRRVYWLKESRGLAHFQVKTDQGEKRLLIQGVRESTQEIRPGHFVLKDIHGVRYRIPDWSRLDRKSRRILEHIV